MSDWKDCVVTLIDLVRIKVLASGPKGLASTLMRKMHVTVSAEMRCGLPLHECAYVWNDSILLLAYLDRSHGPEPVLREVDRLKRSLSYLGESYAISIKGQTFPDLIARRPATKYPRMTLIKASSFAMANCFRVEETIGKKLKRPWYVDSRLAGKIHTTQLFIKKSTNFLPGPETRDVHVYAGYLWEADGCDVNLALRSRTRTLPGHDE